uniref:VWFA domain-containing protein n=1 Tax=Oryzias latipes TaxID=8090 RepID=A0A3P9JLR9_ORYLA
MTKVDKGEKISSNPWTPLFVLSSIRALLIFTPASLSTAPSSKLTCSLEVAFILDSSESSKCCFEKQKAFVLKFSTRLAMLPVDFELRVRMAVVQFSSSVYIEHRFSDFKDLDTFQGKVSAMNYIGHGTYTTYAITNTTQMLVKETPKNSVRVAVLMTDGVDHPRNPDVLTAAAEAKGYGIKIFAIGLSSIAQQRQNNAKLRGIASAPPQQFEAFSISVGSDTKTKAGRRSWDDAEHLHNRVNSNIHLVYNHCCHRGHVLHLSSNTRLSALSCGECISTPLELIFVIDSSESVGPENFNLIKDFVNAVVDRTSVGRNSTRIGVVLYSHINLVVLSLMQEATKDQVKSAVRSMSYLGEGTYTGSAIQEANQMFKAARAGVRKVAIVITDGQTDTRDSVSLESAVAEAQRDNIERFVIGVVNESDPQSEEFKKELNFIASDPDSEHVFLISDFKTLQGDKPHPFQSKVAQENLLINRFEQSMRGHLLLLRHLIGQIIT